MPIYRIQDKMLYFAHVPKCAGSSLNTYLEARFGPPAFQDRGHIRNPAAHPWSRTSPQHIDADALARLFPPGFFDLNIAVVRHPVARLTSVYLFQRYNEKRIPRFMSFGVWLRGLKRRMASNPYIYDNHTRPQVTFLPKDTRVFRLEDDLNSLIAFLDDQFGACEHALVLGHEKKARKMLIPTEHHQQMIRDLYAADFEAFGYE